MIAPNLIVAGLAIVVTIMFLFAVIYSPALKDD